MVCACVCVSVVCVSVPRKMGNLQLEGNGATLGHGVESH